MMVLSRVPRGGRLQISYSFYNVRPVGVRFTLPKGQLTLLHIDTVNRGNSHKESPDKMLGMYLEHLQDASKYITPKYGCLNSAYITDVAPNSSISSMAIFSCALQASKFAHWPLFQDL